MDFSLPGSSVHETSQARILEWVAMSFSRGFSQPRDWTCISCIAGRFHTTKSPEKPHAYIVLAKKLVWVFRKILWTDLNKIFGHSYTHVYTHIYKIIQFYSKWGFAPQLNSSPEMFRNWKRKSLVYGLILSTELSVLNKGTEQKAAQKDAFQWNQARPSQA